MNDRLKSSVVRAVGWPAPLFHSDTAVFDRWRWLARRLPPSTGAERLLDIGCGTGAFTIGASLRGYRALGLSWDTRNQQVAAERARMCRAISAEFEVLDVRALDSRTDLRDSFDVVILFEVIEHIVDDAKLMRDAAGCLKPGGRLLLTTPNFYLRPIDPVHNGPFPDVEDGGHVRKGYTEAQLARLCEEADLALEAVSYCVGFLSQKVSQLYFTLSKIHHSVAWAAVHPLRLLPVLFDPVLARRTSWPSYSICLEARRREPNRVARKSRGANG
jgi:2-polyprenyl-3-methyl-5-hydroxy-6-metoxy-1,4-benzoquinol methylase